MDENRDNPLLASKRPAPSGDPTRQNSLRQNKRLRKTIDSSCNKSQATSVPCSRCRRVNWARLATIPPTGKRPRGIRINATRKELLDSSCRICQMIGTVVPPERAEQFFGLVACPSWSVLCPWHERPVEESAVLDNIILKYSNCNYQFERSGMIGLSLLNEKERFGIRRIKANAVDFGWLNQCLKHCLENHDTRCNHYHDTHDQNKMVPRHKIRLIDCESQDHAIIDAPPKCRYAALSYVWGKSQPENSIPFSQVVTDAIKVTVSLGLQYLWVDKHVCIPFVKIDRLYYFQLTNRYLVYKPK